MDGKIVPIPPSQETVNTLFDANVHSEAEMEVCLVLFCYQSLIACPVCLRRRG